MPDSNDDISTLLLNLKREQGLRLQKHLLIRLQEKLKNSLEDCEMVTSVVGGGKSFVSIMRGTASYKISGSIRLKDPSIRKYKTSQNIEIARKILTGIPGAKVRFTQPSFLGSQKSPLEIEVRGNDIDAIYEVAKSIKNIMEKKFSNELKDIDISRTDGAFEYVINIDRVKAATLGLNVYTIASTLQSALSGIVATQYRLG